MQQNMVDKELEREIKTNIKSYFNSKIQQTKKISIQIIREISGMTNKNFHALVTLQLPMKTEPVEFNLFYRKFGIMSDCLNRELEQLILEEMSNRKLGPELIYKEKDYCILEFITHSAEISLEERYLPVHLNEIIKISVNYSMITNICEFKIKNKVFKLTKSTDFPGKKTVTYSLLDEVKRMLPNAVKSFDKFKRDCKAHYKNESAIPQDLASKIKIFQDTLDNYENLILELFYGNEGFLVLSHNDMHRWNFVKKESTSKIYVIDHEYACMNLIGLDLANYMNENSFYFDEKGDETFKEGEIDVKFYYQIFLQYLEEFKKNYSDMSPKLEKYLNSISNMTYYLNLHRLTNTFWFLFCAINLEFKDGKACPLLKYGCDRLKYAEMMTQMNIAEVA